MSVEADLPALNAARPLDRSIDVHLDSQWSVDEHQRRGAAPGDRAETRYPRPV